MRAPHAALAGTAPFAFQAPAAMNMFPGGSLETTVAVGSGTAVDTAFFVVVVLMQPADIGAARTIIGRAAKSTFGSHKNPLCQKLKIDQ